MRLMLCALVSMQSLGHLQDMHMQALKNYCIKEMCTCEGVHINLEFSMLAIIIHFEFFRIA